MFQSIINFLSQLFGFSEKIADNRGQKIPMQEKEIREKADTGVVREEVKQDRIMDRHYKEEPKILYAFSDHAKYRECVNVTSPPKLKPLYCGDKTEILFLIKKDPAEVLTNRQARELKDEVNQSNELLFVIKFHPASIHE